MASSAAPAGADTPDAAPKVTLAFRRRLAVGMGPLRGRDAAGRMVRSRVAATLSGATPAVAPCSPEVRGQACRLWWGSRQGPSTRVSLVAWPGAAFPSRRKGRTPFAGCSPPDRRSRRPGGVRSPARGDSRDPALPSGTGPPRQSPLSPPAWTLPATAPAVALSVLRHVPFLSSAGRPKPARLFAYRSKHL